MHAHRIIERLRKLTETAPRCSGFEPAPREQHAFCVRCGGEELPHLARAAAELLEQSDAPSGIVGHFRSLAITATREDAPPPIDIINRQLVSVHDGAIVVLAPRLVMTPAEAFVHAAWIAVLAETQSGEFFRPVFERVQQT